MKRLITALIIALSGMISNPAPKLSAEPVPQVGVTFGVFYNGLSPYGSWVSYPAYGYVWVPNAGADFVPYSSGGHWVYTDEGWVWVSDYAWGWAPFHYGRWFYEDSYGWMWEPGTEWAPSWVVWGSYAGYYGWAPIGPGISIYADYRPAERCWTFVPTNRVNAVNVYNYRVNNVTVVNNINRVTVINNTGQHGSTKFFAGPKAAEVEKATGTKVNHVSVTGSSKPGAIMSSGNQVAMYRPTVSKGSVAPAHVAKMENLTPVKKSTGGNAPAKNNAPNNSVNHKTATPAAGNSKPAINNPKPVEKSSPANQSRQMNKAPASNNTKPVEKSVPASQNKQPDRTPASNSPKPVERSAPANQSKPAQPQHTQQPRQQAPPAQPQHIQQPPRQQAPSPQPQHMQEAPHEQAPQAQPQHMQEPPHEQPHEQPQEKPHNE